MKTSVDNHSKIEESLASLNIGNSIKMNANHFNETEIYQTLLYCKTSVRSRSYIDDLKV